MFHQNKNIFGILFEAIPEGVIIIDYLHTIIAANSAALKIFEYDKDELLNTHLNQLIPTKFRTTHESHFNHFLKEGATRKIENRKNLVGLTKSNKEFPLEIGLNPFTVNNNTYIIALIIDVTNRRITEKRIESLNLNLEKKITQRTAELNNTIKQLKEANFNYKLEISKRIEAENKIKNALKKEKELNELKTKFLSLVSHEFKTPLSGVLTSTMLLKKYTQTEQQQKRDKHINTITNKVNYLNNILNDFLSIERLDYNKISYKFTSFNLSKVVNEVIYNCNLLLKSKQKIIVSENTNAFVLFQDEKILELALSNIIYNAIKYSPKNTTIYLHIHEHKTTMVFKITDEGIGIPKNDQKFIFNRYFRAENVLNEQGTGIGLNIVKSHLNNLGGTISFESTENTGSVFTFKLPKIHHS